MHDDLDEPLRLPAPPPAPPRPGLPVAAAIVPVIGAIVLWQLTGSPSALWFAALGPLMAAASFLDGLRSSRRLRRRARGDTAAAIAQLKDDVARRHAHERQRAWMRTPDIAGYAEHPDEIWRAVADREATIVAGRGSVRSALRVEGEAQDADARALRHHARTVDDMPVHVPLTAGIAVVGPAVPASAVVRALTLQACLALPPGRLRLVGDGTGWATGGGELPHAAATRGPAVFTGGSDRPVPADADIPIIRVAEGAPPPPRCAAVLTLEGGDRARLDHDGTSRPVRVEAVSADQGRRLAGTLVARAARLGQRLDVAVGLDDLPALAADAASLAAPIGLSGGDVLSLDLVADGPHAVVIGVTGSGKSELLTTWVAGMCRGRSPAQVSFLLVDFKGGRTFDALSGLPHVTGVLTDLDEARAVRAVESLRAEIRHRERTLALAGARDIAEAGGALARLVIVVDEYAALVSARPELHDLFADIAARGRALGMHLVLASQRAAGAFRDGVLANAPLRVAFRVTDAADSRAILGHDDAAHLPGSLAARGTALVRRASDDAPVTVRVARCDTRTLDTVAAAAAGAPPARRPWLPPLPARVTVSDVRAIGDRCADGAGAPRTGIVLGLTDEPEQQRQCALMLAPGAAGCAVIGGPASGRTTLLRAIAAQAASVSWVPADLEEAWDLVAALDELPRGTVALVDDADALAARFPPDHAAAWVAALERAAREARNRGVTLVLSASRVTGPLGRVIDLLPDRALLPLPSRADHVAAGGESADIVGDAVPGRGRWRRRLVQFAVPDGELVDHAGDGGRGDGWPGTTPPGAARAGGCPAGDATRCAPLWHPGSAAPTALVLPAGAHTDAAGAALQRQGVAVIAVEDAAASGSGVPSAPPVRRSRPPVIIGTPDAWLAQWRMLGDARARGELVVDAACTAEYRALTGRRDLPPYVTPGARRAWALRSDGAARRVTLPG